MITTSLSSANTSVGSKQNRIILVHSVSGNMPGRNIKSCPRGKKFEVQSIWSVQATPNFNVLFMAASRAYYPPFACRQLRHSSWLSLKQRGTSMTHFKQAVVMHLLLNEGIMNYDTTLLQSCFFDKALLSSSLTDTLFADSIILSNTSSWGRALSIFFEFSFYPNSTRQLNSLVNSTFFKEFIPEILILKKMDFTSSNLVHPGYQTQESTSMNSGM